jgi:histidine ammonia-lyase
MVPNGPHPEVIAGQRLTLPDVVRVARAGARVRLNPNGLERARASHALITHLAESGAPLYGITTGSGANRTIRIPPEELGAFQIHLITSHCVGVGPPLPADVVRALMLVRAHGITAGATGAQPAVAQLLVDLLNAGIHPIVPSQGSIGMADLAPMAHAALPLLGLGEVEHHGRRLPAREALAEAGLAPISLGPKDGLTLTSSNAASVGMGILVAADVRRLLAHADAAAALSLEGFSGNTSPLDQRAVEARPYSGHVAVARRVRALLRGSALWDATNAGSVQDPLSFRCIPQVHGVSRDALCALEETLAVELNAPGDNPLVIPEDEAVISNGNFHPGRLALHCDALALALCQQATMAANRIMRLMSPHHTSFPRYLTPRPGINCGFATLQKTFVGLVAEVRHLANPGSLDALPLAEGVEDHAAMTLLTIGKVGQIVERLQYVLACELLVAAQAVDLLGGPGDPARSVARLGDGTRAAYEAVREVAGFLDEDRILAPEVERVRDLVSSGELLARLDSARVL